MKNILIKGIYLFLLSICQLVLSQTPGGVNTNLQLWLKANVGVIQTGSNISMWNDQSGNSLNGTAFNTPTFLESANNFNPSVSFNAASSEYIDLPNGFANYTSGISAYVIAKSNTNASWERFFEFGNGPGNNNILFARELTSNNLAFEVYNAGTRDPAIAINGINNDVNNMYSLRMPGGTPGAKMAPNLYRNGAFLIGSDDTHIPQNVTRTNNYIARSNWSFDGYFSGEISEIIVFNTNNSITDHQKIQSYLAIKYGITLNSTDNNPSITEGDYILSDGSTKIWNYTTNSLYHHDVTGIGRDDVSGLNQKQSISANTDARLTIGLGEIATSNATNPNTFSTDKDFFVWGNDNGSLTLQTTERPTTATATNRLGREWKVAENGNVNNLTLSFSGIPSNAVNLELYVDSDGDGNFTNATVLSGGTLNGNNAVFTGINLNNNYVFTLGYSLNTTYPGGVGTNLNLWLKANDGVTHSSNNVTGWNDNSSNSLNGTAFNTPTLTENANNFNPAVVFNAAAAEYIDLPDGFANYTAGISTYVVAKNTNTGNWQRYFDLGNGAGNNNILFARQSTSNNGAFEVYNGATGDQSVANNLIQNNVNNIYGAIMQGGSPGTKAAPTIFRNGLTIASGDNTNIPQNITRTQNFIARSNWGGDSYFNGEISEIIIYNNNNSSANRQQIESYLAIKYGITLNPTNNDATIIEGDYLLSDGTKVWDYTLNNSYHNDVAGIGFDQTSSLVQKQSKSANSDAIVSIGIGSVASTNSANTNTFSNDKDFLIWGNNNGSTSTQTFELPTTATATFRLGREWKVAENGNVNNLTILFDVAQTNLMNIELFVDTDGDGDFTNATVISGGTIIDGKATFSGINLNNNDVFTLGYSIFNGVAGYKGPGGIGNTDASTELSLWLNANTISGVASGSALASWNDNSGYNHNANQGNASRRATYNTNQLNNYPTVNFDGSDDHYITNYIPVTGANDRTLISVINNATNSPSQNYRHIMHYGSALTNQAYGIAYKTAGSNAIGNHYWFNNFSGSTSFTTAGTIINMEYGSGVDSLYVNNGFSGKHDVVLNTGSAVNLTIGGRIYGLETMQGQIGEIIVFNNKINEAQRIIIDNYLAAKYNISLSGNDFFNEDDIANGNFDHDVAGIGQATDGSFHQDSQGTGIIRINTPSGLDNDEYLFWGRNNKNPITFTASSLYTQRSSTNWRVSKRNDLGSVTLEVDLTGIDISDKEPCTPLKLVVDNNSNLASPSASYNLINITGNIYRATGVNFNDNDYFTIEYTNTIVIDNTQAYNGSGGANVPSTSDGCYKLLVKNTADGSITLTENAIVKELEIETGGKLIVNSGVSLQITNGIINNGEIRLLGTSQLIQTHTGPKQVSGTGNLFKDEQGTLTNVYQSGYWSSPVTTNGSTFTIQGVLKDGTSVTTATSNPPDINFTDVSILDGATTNPITISGRWLAKLINDTDWTRQINPATEIFNPGEGWNMKSTGRAGGQNFTFKGIVNDGNYYSTISSGRLSLLGNPYPSALNTDLFINNNTAAISGTLYFYDAGNDTSHTRASYTGGYATRVIGMGNPKDGGSKTPGEHMDVGQAFFVTRDAAGDGIISFNNTQRVFNPTPQFFSKSTTAKATDFPIIRLGLTFNVDADKTFKRIISTGLRGLSHDFDFGYDAEMFDRHPTDFAFTVNNRTTPFVITGVADFNQALELPIKVYVDNSNNLTFSVEETKNITTNIYLRDALNNKYYNISTAPKTLHLSAGTYRHRFSIVFSKPENSVLNTENIFNPNATDLFAFAKNKHLTVVTNNTTHITTVKLYSILGQEVASWHTKNNKETVKFSIGNLQPAVYIVKIQTNTGIITKRIIIK